MRSNFLSNSNSWKLKNMSLFSTLSVQPTQLQRVSLWIQAFSNSTFLYLQIKSREFRKVYKPLYFIFVSNNYKYSNYRIIEILIECSNFFLSLAYLYIEFSLSLSLNSIKWKNVFSLLYLSKHSILLLSNESFLYIRIISRETCKQVNVTSSQGNDISIVKSRVPFPKQNWLLDLRRG